MSFALCRSEASKAAGIVFYCKAFATKEMHGAKPNHPFLRNFNSSKMANNHLLIRVKGQIKECCGELCGLIDFDHRKEWKLMKTDDDQFIRIQVIDRSSIEVLGPASRKEDLYDHSGIYTRLPDKADNMPFTDSLLYKYGM